MRAMTDGECEAMKAGSCPFCRGKQFYLGPSAGLSVNWKCANDHCEAGFNLVAIPGHGFTSQASQITHEPKSSK